MAERPGIMVYFDLIPQLQEYSAEEIGKLFLAMLEFGAYGTIPTFEDRGLRIIWREIQGKIERDGASYQKRTMDGAYGAYKKEEIKNGREAMPKDAWIRTVWGPSQEVSGSIPKSPLGDLKGRKQLEQEQGTITGTITGTTTGTRAGKGTGTRGEGEPQSTHSFSDPVEFEKLKQAQIEKLAPFLEV